MAPLHLDPRRLDGATTPALPARQRRAATSPAEPGTTAGPAQRLAALPEAERLRELTELVRAEAAAILGHDSARDVPDDRTFSEEGFDSLAGIELRNRLSALTGLRLPTTMGSAGPTNPPGPPCPSPGVASGCTPPGHGHSGCA
ncbi:acyl carrier protein [Streptomyces sp. NBC_01102]|uniref:acyl carrier protein n=1 Tax=Streptomyces sp. NBC_01102 TaxID=2903749 RepID=UPI00386E4AB8|nr:acyl carrier protein [Streptomyces sp. NBC_01102]